MCKCKDAIINHWIPPPRLYCLFARRSAYWSIQSDYQHSTTSRERTLNKVRQIVFLSPTKNIIDACRNTEYRRGEFAFSLLRLSTSRSTIGTRLSDDLRRINLLCLSLLLSVCVRHNIAWIKWNVFFLLWSAGVFTSICWTALDVDFSRIASLKWLTISCPIRSRSLVCWSYRAMDNRLCVTKRIEISQQVFPTNMLCRRIRWVWQRRQSER